MCVCHVLYYSSGKHNENPTEREAKCFQQVSHQQSNPAVDVEMRVNNDD